MRQIKIPNTSIVFDSPLAVDQSTLNWQPGLTLTATTDPSWVGIGYGYMAIPKPNSTDSSPATANPVLFGKQPTSLSAGGIQIPNSSTTLKNPA
jgi:hypothetical protein